MIIYCPPQVLDSLYRYIVAYKAQNDGNAPTMREIVDAGLASSTSVASYRLGILCKQGRIRMGAQQARTIEVVGGRWIPPQEA